MKTIKSVLANRKMFRGGGLVPSGNPMQNMNQASGILSSSDSLIDAVANDALSSQGGPTLSMNQGGVARLSDGGLPNDFFFNPAGTNQAPVIPEYRPGIGMGVPRTRRADVTVPSLGGGTEIRNRPVTEYEHFASPEEWSEMVFATGESRGERKGIIPGTVEPPSTRTAAEERYELMFPYSAQVDQSFMSMNPPIPDEITSQEAWIGEGPPRRITKIASIVPKTIDLLKNLGLRATYEGGKELHAAFEYLMQRSGSDLGHGKIRVLTNMIAAQPEFAIEIGEASNQVLDTEEGPSLSSNDFKLAVSETFFEKKKQIADAIQGTPTEQPDLRFLPGSEWVSEKVMADTDPVSQRETRMALLGQEGSISPDDLSAYQSVMGDPAAQQTFIRELTATKGDEYVAALLAQVPEFTEEDGIVVTGKRIAEDDPEGFFEEQDRARDTSVAGFFDESVQPAVSIPGVTQSDEVEGVDQESLVEGLAKHGELVAKRQMDLGKEGTLENAAKNQQHNTLVEGVREAANTGTAEETKDKLQLYIDEFKGAMPDYEGKSEWEQGMDIVKMGMAIAAGQDPNAITNIANGVLATIDNFTSDDKERREYKREVGFAAAKYGLDAVRNDLVQERADERAIEWFYDKTKATEDMPHGSLVPISMADILSGEADLEFLEHPDIVERKISVLGEIAEAGIKAKADAVKDRTITPTEGDKIEERFNNAAELFETSTAGMKSFNTVIEKLATNPDDYLGGKAEVKSLWGKAMVFAGVDPGKSWLDRKSLEADMKIGFQKLIINALKGVQSANSISNRDVSFLADAYISAGFLTPDGKGGFTFSTELATQRPEILVQRLQSGIEIFREGQQKALNAYDMNIEILSKANAEGRYGPQTYRGQIETLMPYAEVARMERAKDLGTMEYATAIGERPFYYEFDPEAGYKRLKGKEGSPFAGAFFSPTEENWAKFEGN